MITDQLRIARGEKEVPGDIKPEWLGPETRVYPFPRALAGNRRIDRRQWYSAGKLLVSFLSGIVMGGCVAVFVTRVVDGSVMSEAVKA